MTAIKEIRRIKIFSEYGEPALNAFAVIHGVSETTQKTLTANEKTGQYDEEGNTLAFAYEVNYWYDENTKNAGYRSRPLSVAVDGDKKIFTRTLEADLSHASVKNALASNIEHNEKMLQAAHADLAQRFA